MHIQNNDILPKCLCQKTGKIIGNKAIDNKIPQNGMRLNKDNSSPMELFKANKEEGNKNNMVRIYLIYVFIFRFITIAQTR